MKQWIQMKQAPEVARGLGCLMSVEGTFWKRFMSSPLE